MGQRLIVHGHFINYETQKQEEQREIKELLSPGKETGLFGQRCIKTCECDAREEDVTLSKSVSCDGNDTGIYSE